MNKGLDVVQVRTCWLVGRHIVEFEQGGAARAAYGKGLLPRLAEHLTQEFGGGFDASNLYKMSQFYRLFPILDALRLELSWTHYRLLLRVEEEAARHWYMNEAVDQNWSTRALERQIGTLYYERLLASKDRPPVRAEAAEKLAALPASPREFIRDPVVLCARKDQSVVRYSVLHGHEHLFATKYKLVLPTEGELRAELIREQELLAAELPARRQVPAGAKPSRKRKGGPK